MITVAVPGKDCLTDSNITFKSTVCARDAFEMPTLPLYECRLSSLTGGAVMAHWRGAAGGQRDRTVSGDQAGDRQGTDGGFGSVRGWSVCPHYTSGICHDSS